MAGEQVTFASAVSDFVKKSDARMLAVFRTSVERVINEMQTPVGAGGNMPVDTGFLRASLQITLDAPVPINSKAKPADGKAYAYDAGSVAVVLLGAEIGQTVFASYTASYALPVHYGWEAREAVAATPGQEAKPARKARAGRQWVTMAAMKWPAIVTAVCNELRQATESK